MAIFAYFIDGLLLIFTCKQCIISLKPHRGRMRNLRRPINQVQRKLPEYQGLTKKQSILPCALIIHSLELVSSAGYKCISSFITQKNLC